MAADYILRLLQQISMILAGIIQKRQQGENAAALVDIESACLEQIGLPLALIKQTTPDDLASLLEAGGARRLSRSLILAELLGEEAIICEKRGNAPSAAISYAHAERLLSDSLPHLGPEEKAHFSRKLEDISTKRIDLG